MLPPIIIFPLLLRLFTTKSTPLLLNPNLLIRDESSFNLKILFFSFPGCDLGVTVPISIKPNPKFDSSLNNSAFLSNPAASPMGLGNFIPKISLSSDLDFKEKSLRLK